MELVCSKRLFVEDGSGSMNLELGWCARAAGVRRARSPTRSSERGRWVINIVPCGDSGACSPNLITFKTANWMAARRLRGQIWKSVAWEETRWSLGRGGRAGGGARTLCGRPLSQPRGQVNGNPRPPSPLSRRIDRLRPGRHWARAQPRSHTTHAAYFCSPNNTHKFNLAKKSLENRLAHHSSMQISVSPSCFLYISQ